MRTFFVKNVDGSQYRITASRFLIDKENNLTFYDANGVISNVFNSRYWGHMEELR